MQQNSPFQDAFVMGFSEQEWSESRVWHELRMSGYGVHMVVAESDASNLRERWKDRFRAWPLGDGQVQVLVGPFWSEEAALRARGLHSTGSIWAFPEGLVIEPVSSERPKDQTPSERSEVIDQDVSVWVVRIAEFPLGAPSTARAALLRLPDQLAVRTLPWGGGNAYITRKIEGEEEALRALAMIQAAGFNEARLLATSND